MGGGGGSKGGVGAQELPAVPIQPAPPQLLGQSQGDNSFQKLMDELFSRMKARELGLGNLGFAPENQQGNNIEI